MTKYLITLITYLSILGLLGCRKTPENPCSKVSPFKVSFTANEFPGDSIFVDTDAILVNSNITFTATAPTDGYFTSFTWKFGEDTTVRTGRQVRVLFREPNVLPGDSVMVTVVGTSPDHSCFPGRKNIDSFSRKFRFIDLKDAQIIGRYRGLFGNDLTKRDTQTVEIRYFPPQRDYPRASLGLINVQKGCNTFSTNPNNLLWWLISGGGHWGNRSMSFFAETVFFNGCLGPSAWVRLSPTNKDSLIIDYNYSFSSTAQFPKIRDKFLGKRTL